MDLSKASRRRLRSISSSSSSSSAIIRAAARSTRTRRRFGNAVMTSSRLMVRVCMSETMVLGTSLRNGDVRLIPAIIPGLVASNEEDRPPRFVERKQYTPRVATDLDAKFLQIGDPAALDRIDIWPAEHRPLGLEDEEGPQNCILNSFVQRLEPGMAIGIEDDRHDETCSFFRPGLATRRPYPFTAPEVRP